MGFPFFGKKQSLNVNSKDLVSSKILKEEVEALRKEFEEKLEREKEDNALKIATLLDSVLSLIEILEEKEVFSEDELDDVFKRLDKESYERLKRTYAEYNASKEELAEMGYIEGGKKESKANENNESNAGNSEASKK